MNFANLVKMYAIARFARNLLYSCKAESLNLKVGIKRTNPNPKIKVSFHRSILRWQIVWSWSESIIKEIRLWKNNLSLPRHKMTLFAFCISKLFYMTFGHLQQQKFGLQLMNKKLTLRFSKGCEKIAKIAQMKIRSLVSIVRIFHSVCKSPKMSHAKFKHIWIFAP